MSSPPLETTPRQSPPSRADATSGASLEGAVSKGFWIAGAILLIAGGVSAASLVRFQADADWVAHTHQVIEQTQKVLARLVEIQSGQRGYIITGDETFLRPYHEARTLVPTEVAELHRLTADNPAQRSILLSLDGLVKERLRYSEAQVEARRTQTFEVARETVGSGRGEDVTNQIRATLTESANHERSLLADRARRSETSWRIALAAIGGLTVVAFTVLGLTARRVQREIGARAHAQAHVERLNTDLARQASELAEEVAVRQAAEEAARRRNEDLKGFAYTVSHDLKAPLRGIAGYAQELDRRHQEGLSERARFCVAQIITASKNLDLLIDDLLRYARLDAEAPKLSNVNLAELVAGLLRDRKHTIVEQGVDVKVTVPETPLSVWERGLHQVLANLIDNAIKYSRNSRPPRLSIESKVEDHFCRITVTDNGIGFDMKYHDRIFGLFNRLVRANEFEGTGAGLAIVKKVVEKLEGSIHAQSKPGEGSTFILDLPTIQSTRPLRA